MRGRRAGGLPRLPALQAEEASLAEQHAAVIAATCRRIEQAEQAPKLDALAAAAGISPFHFHRLFKSVTGVTPKAYGAAHRAQRICQELAGGKRSVTEAIYDAGFNSSSRFYATANDVLGMTPSAFRAGGADADIRFAHRRMFARLRSWSPAARRASAPSFSATIREALVRDLAIGSRRPT